MLFVWLCFFAELLVSGVLRIFFPQADLSLFVIIINVFFVFLSLLRYKKDVAVVMLVALITRLGATTFDLFTNALSNTNDDIDRYYNSAVLFAEKITSSTGGGAYSWILGNVFRLVGSSRLMGAYINVLLGISVVWLSYLVLIEAKIPRKTIIVDLVILSLFPYSVFSSCVVYRETIIAFLLILSVKYAYNWYIHSRLKDALLAIIVVGFSAAFHAGMLFFGVGYIFLFLMYSRNTNRFILNYRTLPYALIIIVVLLSGLYLNPSLFLGKFIGKMDSSSILFQFNRSSGGSAYLTSLKANSTMEVILFSPLKLFFFLFSPLPMNWRGIVDVITFMIDSVAYLGCFYTILKWNRQENNCFVIAITIGLLACAFVFSIGTWNAGTAIRHRNKLFAVLLFLTTLSAKHNKSTAQE